MQFFFESQERCLFRPRFVRLCHQKPSPAREAVPLCLSYPLKRGIFLEFFCTWKVQVTLRRRLDWNVLEVLTRHLELYSGSRAKFLHPGASEIIQVTVECESWYLNYWKGQISKALRYWLFQKKWESCVLMIGEKSDHRALQLKN